MMVVLCGCSVKRNNFFSRNYHQLTTRYNVYFNGDQALKSGNKAYGKTGIMRIIPTFCLFSYLMTNRRVVFAAPIWTT